MASPCHLLLNMEVGIDQLPTHAGLLRRLRQGRVGVLAHAASVNRDFRHLLDVFAELGIGPRLLFAPEHGFTGAAQDMASISHGHDSRAGAAVISLYGDEPDDLVPQTEHLDQLEVLLVDLVDVGARYYTFVWTALLALRAAAGAGVHVVVFDRPNPLSGQPASVEGQTQQSRCLSFVGLEPVPIRHALTIGELLAYHAHRDGLELGPAGALSLVPVVGWDRNRLVDGWDRPFVPPSPNMPTENTALVYPGGCLLEGTNLSEGRGHTRPFEVVGAPWLDGHQLGRELAATGLPGFRARPVCFEPTFHKHAGQTCGGVHIHVTNTDSFRPVATYVALVALARQQNTERFTFRTERYEFVDDIPAFDLLTGSAAAREAICAGVEPGEVAAAVSSSDPSWSEQMAQASELVKAASWAR